ncbi:MAG: flagellar filament capping protein FliD [Ilumatobacter sp.]|uniref:flagellar filament capping protein FliD n=1 Tax=Ilumatobacter sp. TaxID=1967498 RepID=UPI00261EB0FC|nr:flagellar filament capping protein FliD [Ilumatobacter sp.]MDJ0767449.1 flagellar filament capping protein FliD [Ilumatobacter sp.]
MEIAGIDADFIVSQLMQIEQRPLVALEARRDDARVAADAIAKIRTSFDAVRIAAGKLAEVASFATHQTSVSLPDVVSASAGATAIPSSLTFTVGQLAQAHGLRSVGTVVSDSVAITAEDVLVLGSDLASLGISGIAGVAGVGAGEVSISVTQGSAAAASTGTSSLAASTTITSSNRALDVTVNGVARTIDIALGTYDEAGLVSAVQDALDASGGGITASLGGSAELVLSTTREGSDANVQVTGGDARTTLGLAVDVAANTGVDAIVDVDGTTTTLTSIDPGQAVTVAAAAGSLDLTVTDGLRTGSRDVSIVDTGDGSMRDVVAAINDSDANVSAAAVRVDDHAWRLQLTARSTGEDGEIVLPAGVFDGIGGMIESSAARNAVITIGEGPGAYQVESAGNTFTDVMSGVTLTVTATSPDPVTVGVTRDDDAIADRISNLVSAVNASLGEIKVQTRYDVATGSSGALVGNSTVRRLTDELRTALGAQVDGLATSLPSSVGIRLERDGSFSFDRAAFTAAIEDDPDAVARLFGRGGTTTGDAVFAGAGAMTTSGSYAVDVTTAATRATSALLFDGGVVTNTTVGIRVGDTTVSVDVMAGQSAGSVADQLNAALADAGLELVAETDGTGLRVRASAWGTSGDFELNLDVGGTGTWDPLAGTDVEGTIAGVAATGIGRRLTLSTIAESPAAGLAVDVVDGVVGAIGDVEYRAGIAARVEEVMTRTIDSDTGALETAKDAEDRRVESFNEQIERLEDRLLVRETNLRRQWSNLQTLLSGLQTQGDWLSGQLATLPSSYGATS